MENILEFNEYHNPQFTDQELLEMSNYWGKNLGLDENIVIFIGPTTNTRHGARIKVSNISGKAKANDDGFSISVPDLKISGHINTKHITSKKLNSIFEFIELNKQGIIDICNQEIDTFEFIQKIVKYDGKKK